MSLYAELASAAREPEPVGTAVHHRSILMTDDRAVTVSFRVFFLSFLS